MENPEDNKILEEIRIEFFKLAETQINGYYISLIKTYEWLCLNLTDDTKKKIFQRILRSDDYSFIEAKDENDTTGHFIVRKDGEKTLPWFSTEGFKMFCLISKSPKSKYILSHFIQCEKDYLRVLRQTEIENKTEINNLKEKIIKYESSIIKLSYERDDL